MSLPLLLISHLVLSGDVTETVSTKNNLILDACELSTEHLISALVTSDNTSKEI